MKYVKIGLLVIIVLAIGVGVIAAGGGVVMLAVQNSCRVNGTCATGRHGVIQKQHVGGGVTGRLQQLIDSVARAGG